MPAKPCSYCNYPGHTKFSCPVMPRQKLVAKKPMNIKGKKTLAYEKWRDTVARPYLDKTFGHKCAKCGGTENLEVDHIENRSTHPDKIMSLENIQYLCAYPCHHNKTYRINP